MSATPVMTEGARPDVARQHPDYPHNTQAGWGYMMLTNFLPNGGNGTYIIEAVATDYEGKQTSLGTKTIYCDNANAVKPFGALDEPTQGGTASGSAFVNWGWALTPQPNSIPSDGSTINVYVDGVYQGHPTYNQYRQDIADLFPGYMNSNGAVGYFNLDTTAYTKRGAYHFLDRQGQRGQHGRHRQQVFYHQQYELMGFIAIQCEAHTACGRGASPFLSPWERSLPCVQCGLLRFRPFSFLSPQAAAPNAFPPFNTEALAPIAGCCWQPRTRSSRTPSWKTW